MQYTFLPVPTLVAFKYLLLFDSVSISLTFFLVVLFFFLQTQKAHPKHPGFLSFVHLPTPCFLDMCLLLYGLPSSPSPPRIAASFLPSSGPSLPPRYMAFLPFRPEPLFMSPFFCLSSFFPPYTVPLRVGAFSSFSFSLRAGWIVVCDLVKL